MRVSLTFVLLFTYCTILGQQVKQVQIKVNDQLTILTDVTADKDSIPNGRYLVVYKNSTIVKGNTKNGKMHGSWTLLYPNGQQKLKARYVDGKPHGEWTMWNTQGAVQAKIQYNHGAKIGHWQGYYYNHSKAIDLVYNPDGKPAQCIQYFKESEIISLNHVFSYDDELTKAEFSYYYKNYNIFHYEEWKEEKLDGLYITYHDNGGIWESFKYENGRLLAINESHSVGGMPRKNEYFRHGTGEVNRYYANGNLFSKTNYQNGIKNGEVTVYGQTGKVENKGFYANNTPIGNWKVKYNLRFTNDPNTTFATFQLSPAEKEIEEGPLRNGYRHGTWKRYDHYGDLIMKSEYRFGFLHGAYTRYQSRKKMEETLYENGNKKGKSIYYSTFGEVNSQEQFDSESHLDTNWFNPPQENLIRIINRNPAMNQIHFWYYENLPGTELISVNVDPFVEKELLFSGKRDFSFQYAPQIIPAHMSGDIYTEKNYIRKNLKIPESAKKLNVDGSVLLQYKVDELGIISDIKVLRSIGNKLDEAAIDVIKSFPPLNSATFNGIPISCYIVREIDIKL